MAHPSAEYRDRIPAPESPRAAAFRPKLEGIFSEKPESDTRSSSCLARSVLSMPRNVAGSITFSRTVFRAARWPAETPPDIRSRPNIGTPVDRDGPAVWTSSRKVRINVTCRSRSDRQPRRTLRRGCQVDIRQCADRRALTHLINFSTSRTSIKTPCPPSRSAPWRVPTVDPLQSVARPQVSILRP